VPVTAPFFSVAIPTFSRPNVLRDTINSVLAQSFHDYEIVVSDDEVLPGETWHMLEGIAGSNPRIRPVRNAVPHGQVPNTNNAIRHSRGKWVKVLHDDDLMRPNCLASFHEALWRLPAAHNVIVASCRSDDLRLDGSLKLWKRKAGQPWAELLPQRYTALAMYIEEDVGSSLPSCVCINRAVLESENAWMPEHPDFRSSVDSHWAIVLGTIGDKLILNDSLIIKRQEAVSVTGATSDRDLDRERAILREIQRQAIPADLSPPPLTVARQAHDLRRAAHRLIKRRNPVEAARILARCWHPAAWWLLLSSQFAGSWPFRLGRTPRIPMGPAPPGDGRAFTTPA
jgi:hypothetical protein